MILEPAQILTLIDKVEKAMPALTSHQAIMVVRALEYVTTDQGFEKFYGTYGVECVEDAVTALLKD